MVAGLLALTTAAAVLLVAAVGAAGLTDIVNGSLDTSDRPLYIASGVLTVPVIVLGAMATAAAARYALGRDVSGARVAWTGLATWLLLFAWGIPASGAWLSAALVIYTALALPVVGLVLLVSWLARRGDA